jgi:hypothetical protein
MLKGGFVPSEVNQHCEGDADHVKNYSPQDERHNVFVLGQKSLHEGQKCNGTTTINQIQTPDGRSDFAVAAPSCLWRLNV